MSLLSVTSQHFRDLILMEHLDPIVIPLKRIILRSNPTSSRSLVEEKNSINP